MEALIVKNFSAMNKSYILSYVAPVYGVEKYIEKFARSVLSQEVGGVQFVFVDDGCEDSSMDILNALIDKEFSWRKDDIVIVRKPNGGLPEARRTGVENAGGEYILFGDSDDWLEPDALRKVVAVIEETHADIVYFDAVKEYAGRRSVKRERDYDASSKADFIVNIFNYKSQGYTVTKCFRRELYDGVFIPPYGMHEDIYLMSQIIYRAQSLVHLKEVLYHYRKDNETSFCAQSSKNRHLNSDRNMLDLYEHFRGNLAESPISQVWGGILMRVGAHAITHKQDYFKEYPYLAADIGKAPLSGRYRISIPGQIIVKLYTYLCKR